jgi:hypothetical protein
MKITLDHNVIIDLVNSSENVSRLLDSLINTKHQAFVVEIGASEMRQRGIRPERYDLFEQLLQDAGVSKLPRLTPMMIWDVTFWDHGLWCDEKMEALAGQIEEILFGGSPPINASELSEDSPKMAAWLNRLCDVQTMWCHLHYANDVFVTSDRNFHKATKTPRLLSLGAGRICRPEDL